MARKTKPKPKQASRKTALRRYREKRDFSITPEPASSRRGKGDLFVIQKHAARRLHYDFRLELNGTLKSWAVTRGPSLDPRDRRLAVHVEDHPLDYADFEGTIPRGQYGGGTVMVWDTGTWMPIDDPDKGYKKGHLSFELHGKKLRGHWTLVRMRPRAGSKERHENWLLIKGKDEYARPGDGDAFLEEKDKSAKTGRSMEKIAGTAGAVWQSNRAEKAAPSKKPSRRAALQMLAAELRTKPAAKLPRKRPKGAKALPDFIAPQLPTLVTTAPSGSQWLHEIKLDGYRVYCRIEDGACHFLTRRGLDWTDKFGALAHALDIEGPAALDGEIVVLDAKGVSDFGALQAALSAHKTDALVFFVFDLMHLDGQDLRPLPLNERKDRLKALVERSNAKGGKLIFSEHFKADGPHFHENACHLALEGVVSKRADAPYRSGRSDAWLKTKCRQRQEVVIGGFTERRSGPGHIGALLVGVRDGGALRYAGRVGTGFNTALAKTIRPDLDKRKIEKSPFAGNVPRISGVAWVKPDLVCEVEFHGWTRDGVLRQASFEGMRMDKPAKDVVRERAVPTDKVARKSVKAATPKKETTAPSLHGVKITHPDRVLYKAQGLTKLDLANYYAAMADRILLHVADRPLSVVRCPGGADAKCFYQKHPAEGMSESIDTVRVRGKTETENYIVIHDAKGLLELVQFGSLEFHPWGSHADDLERPDRLIFDLDPDPSVGWKDVASAAVETRDLLEELGLKSFVKTTGGKGLHVVVPIAPGPKWPEVKTLCKLVADTLAARAPKKYTTNMSKKQRKGRIFIDYLRNDRGSTAVAAYTTRARDGATVATPITWKELAAGIKPADFNVKTVPDRLKRLKKDPWEGFFKLRQKIPKAPQAQLRDAA
jgi:bifunctional non-homologous end joining protein LigD